MVQDTARFLRGFTMIELLIVMGILSVILTILIVAINPFEQLHRTSDVASKGIAQDFITASQEYLASQKELPWQANAKCNEEFTSGKTLDQMPDCTTELTGGGKLQETYASSSELKDIVVNVCGDSAVLCYSPKSKIEYEDGETHYDKFGVNDPGCPGHGGPSDSCYWCRPLNNETKCTEPPTPTPTLLPTPTPTPTSLPTATPVPTDTPIPTPTPTPSPSCQYKVGSYCLDDTKLFQTYAVFLFDQPSFVSDWYEISVSTNPTFPQDYTQTEKYFAPVSMPQMGSITSPSHKAYMYFTNKLIGFQSLPYQWQFYTCGKTLYWKVWDYPSHTHETQTFSNVIDCTTKVGAFSTTGNAPLNWYIYYPYINADGSVRPGQPYNATMDANGDGKIDWYDYQILSMNTRMRAGGWQLPE